MTCPFHTGRHISVYDFHSGNILDASYLNLKQMDVPDRWPFVYVFYLELMS